MHGAGGKGRRDERKEGKRRGEGMKVGLSEGVRVRGKDSGKENFKNEREESRKVLFGENEEEVRKQR